jgi:hypothetical protein
MKDKYVAGGASPTYMYNKTHYPFMIAGSCYAMPISAAECLLNKSMDFLYFQLEDVFITGFVGEACSIPRINYPGEPLYLM